MSKRSCPTCGKYQIRRNFSFRGEGNWKEHAAAAKLKPVVLKAGEYTVDGNTQFLQCTDCHHLLKLSIQNPDHGDLYTAKIVLCEQAYSVSESSVATTAAPKAPPTSGKVPRKIHQAAPREIEGPLPQDMSASLLCSAFDARYGPASLTEKTVEDVDSVLKQINGKDLKLRTEIPKSDVSQASVTELWMHSDFWVLAHVDGLNIEGNRFLWGRKMDFLISQLERFIVSSHINPDANSDWVALKCALQKRDAQDLAETTPWVKARIEQLEKSWEKAAEQ